MLLMRYIETYDFVYAMSMTISRPKDDAVREADKWMVVEIAIVRLDHEVACSAIRRTMEAVMIKILCMEQSACGRCFAHCQRR
jgi:hypothetical protein